MKCFTENGYHQVWSARKLLFWFVKDQHWVGIKWLMTFAHLEYHSSKYGSNLQQRFKHDVLVNLGLQISGSSR